MQTILLSLLSLITSSFFVQFSTTAVTTLVAITVANAGGSQSDVALIASAYSLGFIVGCFLSPPQVFRIGVIRGYTAAAGIMTIAIVALEMLDGVFAWALLRFTMGASFAAIMAIADTWINDKTSPELRGRVLAAYAIVLGLASILSQVFFLTMDATEDGFVLTFALSMNLAVVLVALGTTKQPKLSGNAPRYLRKLTWVSTPATAAAFASGFCTTGLISLAPFYLAEHDVEENMVALGVGAIYLGRLVGQWPVGHYSDLVDRRLVLISLSILVVALCVLSLVVGGGQGHNISGERGSLVMYMAFLVFFLFGSSLYPMYSVGAALAFDRAGDKSMMDISTTLLVVNSVGAILGPVCVMAVAANFGDFALHVCILAVCLALAAISAIGMSSRERVEVQTPAVKGASAQSVGMAEAVAELVGERKEDMEALDDVGVEPEGGTR